jgi:hypothetical protein
MSEKLRRMAEYFQDRNPERAAEAWAKLGEHRKGARFWSLAGDEHRDRGNHERARASYLRAAREYTVAEMDEQARGMREAARDCEAYVRAGEQTEAMHAQAEATRSAGEAQARASIDAARISAGQTKESFAALSAALREGFVATSRALVHGLTSLAAAQKEAAVANAELVFRGFEQLAASQSEGFAHVAGALREGDLLQAFSTYAGLRGVSRQDARAAEALREAIRSGVASLPPAQQESAARNTLRLFDLLTRMLPPEGEGSGRAPERVVQRIVEGEAGHIQDEMGPKRAGAPEVLQVETGHCVVGSGPQGVVLNLRKADGIYQQCRVAHFALKRRWHRIDAFSARYLEQGGCPLPHSLGLVQRHLWFETCVLADGREHKME